MCVCEVVRACVCEREGGCVRVCVCVRDRERGVRACVHECVRARAQARAVLISIALEKANRGMCQ